MAKALRTARINGGSETVRYGSLVEWNDASGKLRCGSVKRIERASGGNVVLVIDMTHVIDAYHARLARPLLTICPGASVTLRADLVHADLRIPAESTVEVTSWRAGYAAVVVSGVLPGVRVSQESLVRALIPGRDLRLVVWQR